jgi:type III secretion protein O
VARYPLQDLLRVRQFREDNASNELTAQRKRVAEAEALVEQRKRERAEFHDWREQEEERLYQSVVQKQVTRQDLDDLRDTIANHRAHEDDLLVKVKESETALEQARESLRKAHAAWLAAQKSRQKITEHREQWLLEEAREAENFADKELEDFRALAKDEDAPQEQEMSDDVDSHLVE